jgi:phosphoglycolate phosphatase-like HAD superfamily hydrolase
LNFLKKKQIKMAIFTGLVRSEAEFLLGKTGLSIFFCFLVTADEVIEPRPHPDALIQAAKRLGVNVDECVYVGDTLLDIEMAKNAKMRVICVKTGPQDKALLKSMNPDYFVEDMSEMLDKIKYELV